MRHQFEGNEERKKRPKSHETDEKKGQQDLELLFDEIDPADFFDPEEFGFRRRGFHAPRP